MKGCKSLSGVLPILRENLDSIHTVAEWAEAVNYSRAHFCVLIKRNWAQTPSEIMRREKYRMVQHLLKINPDQKGRVIAQKAGFKDVKSLYKFLKHHFGTTLTSMRKHNKTLTMGRSNK